MRKGCQAAGAVVALLVAPAVAAEATLPLVVELRARQVAPGEPLRIVVRSPGPLARADGRFLGVPVYLAPDATRTEWSGWSMVALDHSPGTAVLEVGGADPQGRIAAGTRAVTIAEKGFPEERLSVAPRFVEPPPEVRARLDRERERLDAIYLLRTPPVTARPFVAPVPGGPTSVFGTRRLYNGEPRSPHPGLDLRAAEGTEVRAAGAGSVALAEDLYYSGNTVILDHGGGLFTLYAHLSRLGVREGATVTAGDVIGRSGATGRVTGPHLHWGAKIGAAPFDPTALLDERLWR